jgi:PcRGLX-like N-terminal RIFT barrel domain
MMNTLTFEKFSKLDRTEPSSFGIPFAPGELPDAAAFGLMNDDAAIPCQTKVTGTWPDGSVRWLFVRAFFDLPGNAAKQFAFTVDGSIQQPEPPERVELQKQDDGSIRVNTGPLALTVPTSGLWPVCDVEIDGRAIWDNEPFRGVRMQFGSHELNSIEQGVTLTVEEAGPLCAVIRIDADLPYDDDTFPGIRARLFFWAGVPWFTMQYTVVNRSTKLEMWTDVRDWTLDLEPVGENVLLRQAAGCYYDYPQRSGEALEFRFAADWMKRDGFEHQTDCYAHNSWADWQADRGGVMISVRHASQNFPKGYVVETDRICIELYPPGEHGPLEWFAGSAKTHELLFHFHGPDASDGALGCRAAQFQLGDHPRLSVERFAHSTAWVERIFDGPMSRKVLARFASIADNRPVGYGIFNFGDDWSAGYSYQGRGEAGTDQGDKLVWLNNEYDCTHHYYLFYALTGERRFLEYGLNSARHWMDVDIIHSNVDPKRKGGHIAHCRRHCADANVHLSHQWVQGLFDTYHLTGDPDALDLARGVADNIAWQVENSGFLEPGKVNSRVMGWALRALLNAWRETNDDKYRALGDKIEALFADWGRGTGALLANYTVHTELRVNFMNALTGTSLAMWGIETGSDRAKQIAVAVADDIIENGMTVFGLPYYKELPSLRRTTAGIMAMQLFAYAYTLTGDKKYLEAALPSVEDWMANSQTSAFGYVKQAMKNGLFLEPKPFPPNTKSFAVSMPAMLQFIAASGSETLAKKLDFQLEL